MPEGPPLSPDYIDDLQNLELNKWPFFFFELPSLEDSWRYLTDTLPFTLKLQ